MTTGHEESSHSPAPVEQKRATSTLPAQLPCAPGPLRGNIERGRSVRKLSLVLAIDTSDFGSFEARRTLACAGQLPPPSPSRRGGQGKTSGERAGSSNSGTSSTTVMCLAMVFLFSSSTALCACVLMNRGIDSRALWRPCVRKRVNEGLLLNRKHLHRIDKKLTNRADLANTVVDLGGPGAVLRCLDPIRSLSR